jgi:tRNA U54 and U55 pseudouridine synthase Pus10
MDIFGYNKQKSKDHSHNLQETKKVGNTHRRLLVHRGPVSDETMQNSKISFKQIPLQQKTPQRGEFLALF